MNEAQEEKTFVVSLKGIASRVASVRYVKDENDLKLCFVLHQGENIPPGALSIEAEGDRTKSFLLNLLKSHENPQVRLLAVILSKLEYVHRFETFIALISREELLRVGAQEKTLPSVLLELKKAFGEQFSFLVLFDSPFGCQGILWSSSQELRAKVKNITGGQ